MGIFGGTAVEEEPDERGKVFTWTKDKRVWMHLTAFLLFSVIVHGAGFYLFKVVYPSPVRVEPEPDGITVMDPGDPAVRSVLQRLSDRTIFLLPPSAQSEVRVSLETRRARFTPAFQRADLELVPPPDLVAGPGLAEPLPPRSTGRAETEVSSAPGGPARVKVAPSLAGRPLAAWSIFHDYLGLAGALPRVRFLIEISPGGEVKVSGVEAELEEAAKQELAAVVESTLRFEPSVDTTSGWIEVGGG